MPPIIQTCGRCGREVYYAEKKIVLNKAWHNFCFNCVICQKRLNSQNFNSHRGEIFCHSCYEQITSHERDFGSHKFTRIKKYSQSSSADSTRSSKDFSRPARADIVEVCNLRPSEIKNAIRSRRKETLSIVNEGISSKERRRTQKDSEDSKPPQYYNRHRRNPICGLPTNEKETSVNKWKKTIPSDKKPNEELFHKTAKDIRKISSPMRHKRKKLFAEEDSPYETEPQNIYRKILPSYLCKGDNCTCPKTAVYSEVIYNNSFPKAKGDTLHSIKDKTHQKLITQIIDGQELYENDHPNTPKSSTPKETEEILFISESGTTKIVKKTCPKKGKYKEINKTAINVTPKISTKKYNLNEDSNTSLHTRTIKETKKKFQRNDKTVENLSNKKKIDESSKNRKNTKPTKEEEAIRSSRRKVETHNKITNKDHPQEIPKSSKKPQRNTTENVPVPRTVEKTWFLPKFTLFNRKNLESSNKLKVIEDDIKRIKSLSSDSIPTDRRRKSVKNNSLNSKYKSISQKSFENNHETTYKYKKIPNKYLQTSKKDIPRRISSKLCESSYSKNYISPLTKNKLNVSETIKDSDSFIQKSISKKKYKSSKLNEAAQKVTRKSKTPEKSQKLIRELNLYQTSYDSTKDDLNKLHKNIETSKIKDKKRPKQITPKENFTSSVKKKQHDQETASLDDFLTLNMKYTPQNDYNNRKIKNNESAYTTAKKNTQKSSKYKKQTDDYSALKDEHNDTKKNNDHQIPKKDTSKNSSNNFPQKGIFKRIPKIKPSDKELFTTVYNIYPDSKQDIVKSFIQTARTRKTPTNFNNEDSFKRLQTSKNKNSLAQLNSNRKRLSFKNDIDDLEVGRFNVTTEICPKTDKIKKLQYSGDNTTKKETLLTKNDSTKLKATAEVLPTNKTCRENKVTKKQSFLNFAESKNLHYSNKKFVTNVKVLKTRNTVLKEDISQSMIAKRILTTYASKYDRDKEEKCVEKLRKKRFFDPVPARVKSGPSTTGVHPWQASVLDTHESFFQRVPRDGARDHYPNFGNWNKKYVVTKKEVSGRNKCKRCYKNVFIAERIFAENEVYHNTCFSCLICGRNLDSLNVLPRQGEIYCKQCYMKLFGPHTYGFGLCPNLYC